MSDNGYNPDGTPRFRIKDRDDDAKKAERAEKIELEKMENRWWKGRMYKAAQDLLKKIRWL